MAEDEKKTSEEVSQEEQNPKEEAPKKTVEAAPLKGLIGTKIGMTQVYTENNIAVPVTVVLSEGAVVSQVKTSEKDGYNAVQVAYGNTQEKKLNKPVLNHLSKKGISPRRVLHEFRVDDAKPFKIGQIVPVSSFSKGEWVQATGLSKGKGFTGVMKRYGFHGGPHSHGHGEYRRSPGSSGGQQPQRVIPGKRKPGHKGHVWVTEHKVEVVGVDQEKNLILLGGSIPGPNGNTVFLRPTKKKVPVAQKPDAKKKGKK